MSKKSKREYLEESPPSHYDHSTHPCGHHDHNNISEDVECGNLCE